MEDKKSLFEKYKIVKDEETIVENKETEEPVTQSEQPKEIVLPPVENNEEDFFEYNFKDDEEINEIVNSVLGKEEPVVPENEPVSMTVAPLVVTEEKEEPKQVKEKKVKEWRL